VAALITFSSLAQADIYIYIIIYMQLAWKT